MYPWAIMTLCLLFTSSIYIILSLVLQGKSISSPPSPPRLHIIGHLHLLSKLPYRSLHKLSKKYGPIMKINVGFVTQIVVSSSEYSELFLKTHDLNFSNRPRNEVSQCTPLGSKGMLFSEYGTFLRDIRKLCSVHLLSNSKIEYFKSLRKEEINEFINNMKEASWHGDVLNISDEVFLAIETITCRMIFGNANKGRCRVNFKPLVEEGLALIEAFNLNDYFPFMKLFNIQGHTHRSRDIIKIVDGLLDRMVDDYEQQDFIKQQEHHMEFTSVMTSLMEVYKAHEKEVNRTNIKVVIMDLLGGAWKTSATTIELYLKELVKHPEVLKKVQQELENVVGMDRMVEESDHPMLMYLDMVVKEVMRLHPFVTPIPRESVEDVTVNGFFISKKSQLIVNAWAIGRDCGVWSKNAKEFYPERFACTNIDIRGHDFRFIPFGFGRRQCPGLELGLTTVEIILAELLHCFDLKLPHGMIPRDVDLKEKFGGKMSPLFVVPTYRLHV